MNDLEKRIKARGLKDGGGGDTYGPLTGYTAILAGLLVSIPTIIFSLISVIALYSGEEVVWVWYNFGGVILGLLLIGKGWGDASWWWRIAGITSVVVMIGLGVKVILLIESLDYVPM